MKKQINKMNKYFVILILILASTFASYAQDKQATSVSVDNTPIPFKWGDRDRLVRLEANQKALEYRLDVMDKRFDTLQTLIYSVLATLISLAGFTLWDRRSMMKPFKVEQENLKEKLKTYERVMKEYSIDNPKLQEVLKINGLL